MGNLFFPQLASGALTQYPVKRIKSFHTVTDEAEDGTRFVYVDPRGSRMQWDLTLAGLTSGEAGALQSLFEACCGPFRAFTFIDPAANLLGPVWTVGAGIQVSGNTFTNGTSAVAEISQALATPAGYQYAFSVAGQPGADASSTLTLVRRGTSAEQHTQLPLRLAVLVSSGALNDGGATFTAAIQLQPGQSFTLTAAQLEAQPAPSPFRAATGGVYPNAHWMNDELVFTAAGPNSFSTKISIETNV